MNLKSILCSALVGASLTATSLFANAVKLADSVYDGGYNGGEFNATISKDNSFATTADNYSFITFCLEHGINVQMGDKGYHYSIETAALNQNDTLSVGSAWLYEQFFKGTLISADGSGSYFDAAERDYNAGVLQYAFWALENEAVSPGNYYVGLAATHFGSLAAAKGDISASSKVKVLNIWGKNGEDIQSQLIYVPDSGMTVALLGLGLLSLAAFRRKL